jgi:hypothetical protein
MYHSYVIVLTSKEGINCRVAKPTLPPGEKPPIHAHLKQEKKNDNPQHDFLPIVQRVHTQEYHYRYTMHKTIMFNRKK